MLFSSKPGAASLASALRCGPKIRNKPATSTLVGMRLAQDTVINQYWARMINDTDAINRRACMPTPFRTRTRTRMSKSRALCPASLDLSRKIVSIGYQKPLRRDRGGSNGWNAGYRRVRRRMGIRISERRKKRTHTLTGVELLG